MTNQAALPEASDPYRDAFTPAAQQPGTDLQPVTRAELDAILAAHQTDMRTWIRSIMGAADMPEANTDDMAIGMLAQILGSNSSEEALAALTLDRAKQLCGDEPGGRSPVLEIHGVRPMKSDYAEGAGSYVIVNAIRLDTGQRVNFTTGSIAVQTVIWKHVYEGWMPFRACLEIKKERTKAGYYPLNLVAGI